MLNKTATTVVGWFVNNPLILIVPRFVLAATMVLLLGECNHSTQDINTPEIFKVTFPVDSSILTIASDTSITWKNSPRPSAFTVELLNNSNSVLTLTIDETYRNNYQFKIPSDIPASDNYTLKMTSITDPTITSTSETFEIINPYNGSFHFTAPLKSHTWNSGAGHTLQWDSEGFPANNVVLEFYKGDILIDTLFSHTKNDGKQPWLVPSGILWQENYRVKITSLEYPVLFSYSDNFTIEGIKSRDSEEGDSNKNTPIQVDTLQHLSITQGDTDRLAISLNSGTTYYLEDSGSVSVLKTIYFKENQTPLQTISVNHGSYSFIPETSGEYLIVITGSDSLVFGHYDFIIRNETPLDVGAFTIPAPNQILNIETEYILNWKRQNGASWNNINVELFIDTSLVLTIAENKNNSGNLKWFVPGHLPNGENYQLKITSVDIAQLFGVSPVFSIRGIPHDAFENDSIVPLLAVGDTLLRTLTAGDVDGIRLEMLPGKKYLIYIKGPDSLVLSPIIHFTQSGIAFQKAIEDVLLVQAHEIQQGLLQVRSLSKLETGFYTFHYVEMKPESLITFVYPEPSTSFMAGDTVDLEWIHKAPFNNFDSISLYRENQKVPDYISTNNSYYNTSGKISWSLPKVIESADNYYFRISSNSQPGLVATSPYFSISGMEPDIYEKDNSQETATPTESNGTIHIHSLPPSDTDWRSLRTTGDSSYLIKILRDPEESNLLVMTIIDSAGNYNYSPITNLSPEYVIRASDNRLHYIGLKNYNFYEAGDYRLFIQRFIPGHATEFTSPPENTTVNAGSSLLFTWDSNTNMVGNTITISLVMDSIIINNLESFTTNTGEFTFKLPEGLASDTKYQLQIRNSSHYSLSARSPLFTVQGKEPDSLEANNSDVTGYSIKPDSTVRQLNLTAYDEDHFTIACDTNKQYRIFVSGENVTKVHVYSGTTNNFYNSDGAEPHVDVTWKCIHPLYNYLEISHFDPQKWGTYSFWISELP